MDLALDDMYGYWLVLGPNRERGHFLNFLVAPMIIFSAIQAASKSTFNNTQLHSTCDLRER